MADEYLVSVIVPTMNEEESIGAVIDQINKALNPFGNFEILVVDTNSKDKTREIAAGKGARIIDEPRRGYGRAYKTGFAHAKGKFIATLDADCTYPASDIPKFVKMLGENLDFITGDRLSEMEKGVMSKKHKMGNWMLKVATNVLFSMKIADSQSGMWVFRREVLQKFNLISDKMALSEEIKIEAWKKCRFKEVPIKYSPRKGEVKLNTWRDGYGNMKFLFSKRFGKASKAGRK
jgi:glycosyltransferase involved in cell wall biosynthesis